MLPIWSRDGSELFHRAGNEIMAAEVRDTSGFATRPPRQLFNGGYSYSTYYREYDVSPADDFLMIKDPPGDTSRQVEVVFNWLEELQRLAPVE